MSAAVETPSENSSSGIKRARQTSNPVAPEVEQASSSVSVIDPRLSTKGEMGQVVLTLLAMVGQMERRFVKERQREGIARAKADGTHRGGRRRLDPIRSGRCPGGRSRRHYDREGARLLAHAGVRVLAEYAHPASA